MPGWSASVAAFLVTTGAFFGDLEPSINDAACLFEAFGVVRRKLIATSPQVSEHAAACLAQHAIGVAPIQLVRLQSQEDMREAVSARRIHSSIPTSWAPKPRRLSTIRISPTSDSRTLK